MPKLFILEGGTPSLLPANLLLQIKDTACRVFGQPEEITLEANPGLCTLPKLMQLRQGGFNRISFGVQSLDEEELKQLGRLHSSQQAEQAILQASQAGFTNLSADVMLAIPGQTESSLARTLARLTALPITHLSAYLLKAEPGTPFYTPEILSLTQDEERCRSLYLQTVSFLEQAGFPQYEISNFFPSRPGKQAQPTLLAGKRIPGVRPGSSFLLGRQTVLLSRRPFRLPGQWRNQLGSAGTADRSFGRKGTAGTAVKARHLPGGIGRAVPLLFGPSQVLLPPLHPGRTDGGKSGRICLTPEGFLVSNEIIVQLLERLEP